MKSLISICLILGLLLSSGICDFVSPPNEVTEQIRKRADSLLSVIQSGQWTNCVRFIAVQKDAETLRGMGVSKDASSEAIAEKVAAWFKGVYDIVRPGRAGTIRICKDDKNLALIQYDHEDVDSFVMRRVDGEWYYTLDERAKPYAPANGASPRR